MGANQLAYDMLSLADSPRREHGPLEGLYELLRRRDARFNYNRSRFKFKRGCGRSSLTLGSAHLTGMRCQGDVRKACQ